MGLMSERLPNLPLTGPELREFLLFRFDEALSKDWLFNVGTAYPRAAFKITVEIQCQNPNLKPRTIEVLNPQPSPVESPLPLAGVSAEDSGVNAFTIEDTVDNPNVARVHAGIPVEIIHREPPSPTNPSGRTKVNKVTYSKHGAPDLPPAIVTDKSEEVAARLGLKKRVYKKLDPAPAPVVNIDPADPDDLDAVSTEEE